MDVPAPGLHALDGTLKALATDGGVADAGRGEIEPDAAHAGLAHRVELAVRGLVVDDGDAAPVGTARLHAAERGRVVGALDARRHDDHALDVTRPLERRHLFGERRLPGIDAPRE